MAPKIAIVTALEREVRPLLRHWRLHEQEHAGRSFRFFENRDAVLVCAGIGSEAARRAAEAAIKLHAPDIIYSAGFAGALDPALRIAAIVVPRRVVDAGDGSSVDTGTGEGVLVSFDSIASPEQKAKLSESFRARAVDMEAAAVARAAEARGVRFAAVKAISDESGFAFPAIERFVSPDGQFRTVHFAIFALARPWLWGKVLRLARNSARAAQALSDWLERLAESQITESPITESKTAESQTIHSHTIESKPVEISNQR